MQYKAVGWEAEHLPEVDQGGQLIESLTQFLARLHRSNL